MTALTPDEWRRMASTDGFCEVSTTVERVTVRLDGDEHFTLNAPHAVAALCLHGQSFGFTAFHVALLHVVADARDEIFGDDERAEELRHLADKIAALLPPDTPQTDTMPPKADDDE